MINGHYFPFEASLLHEDKVDRLTNKLGPAGFGVYVLLLNELRYRENYRCSVDSLRKIAALINADPETVKQVVYDFGLFTIETIRDDETYFTSTYILRVMDNLERKRKQCSEAGKLSAKKRKKQLEDSNSNERSTIEKKREEKNKKEKSILKNTSTTALTIVEGDASSSNRSFDNKNNNLNFPSQSAPEPDNSGLNPGYQKAPPNPSYKSGEWLDHIEEIFADEEWTKRMAKQTQMKGNTFRIYRDVIVEAFKDHVVLQTTDTKPMTLNDMKVYFANFMRPDTPTYERVKEQIKEMSNEHKCSPKKGYETVNCRGERKYYGIPIPGYAPPRPGNDVLWDDKAGKWVPI